MSVAIVTGSAGLIGSEAARYFADAGMDVIGIDNDMRSRFFGDEASTSWNRDRLRQDLGRRYWHEDLDIRNEAAVDALFKQCGNRVELVIHAAAQPSHDWAAREPKTDFSVNAVGTLNLLEAVRKHAPNSVFIFTSTNKVYGDTPNRLPLVELQTRWEIDPAHEYANGIREDMSIDQSLHSLFGVSKAAADVLVQEYGRYFDLATACFLAYLMKCAVTGEQYSVFGYQGKQVRDNIHSKDLIRAFDAFYKNPRPAAVYNIGGGRHSNCSMLEAIDLCEQIAAREMNWKYNHQNRVGDHQWWISDISRFQKDYPSYQLEYDVPEILQEIFDENVERWAEVAVA